MSRKTAIMAEPKKFLPNRKFIRRDDTPQYRPDPNLVDEYGFFVGQGMSCEELLKLPGAIILAPPWTGKTWVSKEIDSYLSTAENKKEFNFGNYHHLTAFERYYPSFPTIPPWWNAWLSSKKNACWIVDAVDESHCSDNNLMCKIIDTLDKAKKESALSRLRLFLFCRENIAFFNNCLCDELQQVKDIFTQQKESKLKVFQLAPPDQKEARNITGPEHFKKVCGLIKQHNLASFKALPAVLKALAEEEFPAGFTHLDMWRFVLKNVLRDRREEKKSRTNLGARKIDTELQLKVVAKIAAVMTFNNSRGLITRQYSTQSGPTIPQIFAGTPSGEEHTAISDDALNSAIFRPTANGYTFASAHVQELLTALALLETSWDRSRPLFVGEGNTPFPEYMGILDLYRQFVSTDNLETANEILEISGGIPTPHDAIPWSLDNGKLILQRILDTIEEHDAPLSIYGLKGTEHLCIPGMGKYISTLLSSKDSSPLQKSFLLQVALEIKAEECLPYAVKVLQDSSQDNRVHIDAAYLIRVIGKKTHLEALEKLFSSDTPQPFADEQASACILLKLYEERLWSHEKTLLYAPKPEPFLGDARSVLISTLKSSMKCGDARKLLRKALKTGTNSLPSSHQATSRHEVEDSFEMKALQTLIKKRRLGEKDTKLISDIFCYPEKLGWNSHDISGQVVEIIRSSTKARRQLFSSIVSLIPDDQPLPFQARRLLISEDTDWLVKLAMDSYKISPRLIRYALRHIYRNSTGEKRRKDMLRKLSRVDRDAVKQFQKEREREEAENAKYEAEEEQWRSPEEHSRLHIRDLVENALKTKMPLRQQLHRLSWFCFVDDTFRPGNLDGKWEDLDESTQQKVYEICEQALKTCKPTAIPSTNSFPTNIIYEGAAFRAVLEYSQEYRENLLTGAQVKKWLPAIFLDCKQSLEGIVKLCHERAPAETNNVITKAIQREIAANIESNTIAFSLPVDLWTDELIKLVMKKVLHASKMSINTRRSLLGILANANPALLRPTVDRWVACTDNKDKQQAGLDVMIALDPANGMAELQRQINKYPDNACELLTSIGTLTNRFSGIKIKFSEWPAGLLRKLHQILHEHFPPYDDPNELGARFISAEDTLRELRDSLPRILFAREDPESQTVLDEIAEDHPKVKDWLKYEKARAKSAKAIANASALLPKHAVDIDKIVRILDDQQYRLIRSHDDLLRLVVEVLTTIGRSAKQHATLFYETNSEQLGQKVRHEECLCDYLACRLADLLPQSADKIEVKIDRENQTILRKRTDLEVSAPTPERNLVTVVVEVKWSKNRDVSTSLTKQLGEHYLAGANRTHGIYLVGWCPTRCWRTPPGKKPEETMTAWHNCLKSQAKEFSSKHKGINIDVIVMDLLW